MNICWVTLKVKNLEESLKFYTKILNLKVATRFNTANGLEIAMLGEDNDTKIELIYDYNKSDITPSDDMTIGFNIESLDDMIKFLKERNVNIKMGPISPKEGVRFIFIDDPSGYEIQLVENY